MFKNSIVIILIIISGCSGKIIPSKKNLNGVWGLTNLKVNEDYLKNEENLSNPQIESLKALSNTMFDNNIKNGYKVMRINDSITLYRRKQGIENNNFQDKNSYYYEGSDKFRVIKINGKHYICLRNFDNTVDTDTMKIFKLTKTELLLEDQYDKSFISEYKRIN